MSRLENHKFEINDEFFDIREAIQYIAGVMGF